MHHLSFLASRTSFLPMHMQMNNAQTSVYLGAQQKLDFIKFISSMQIKGKPLNGVLLDALSCLQITADATLLVSALKLSVIIPVPLKLQMAFACTNLEDNMVIKDCWSVH